MELRICGSRIICSPRSVFANIANNYDKFNYTNPPKDSHLRRVVRTHVREYVQNDAL